MKGYYTKRLIESDEMYKSLIFSYMDKFLKEIDDGYLYTQFNYRFNRQGEFIYRAIHNKTSAFDTYSEIEMRVNDEGVFVYDLRHGRFSTNYLYALNIFKQRCSKQSTFNL